MKKFVLKRKQVSSNVGKYEKCTNYNKTPSFKDICKKNIEILKNVLLPGKFVLLFNCFITIKLYKYLNVCSQTFN